MINSQVFKTYFLDNDLPGDSNGNHWEVKYQERPEEEHPAHNCQGFGKWAKSVESNHG